MQPAVIDLDNHPVNFIRELKAHIDEYFEMIDNIVNPRTEGIVTAHRKATVLEK